MPDQRVSKMAEIRDVMAYIIKNYPHKHELSNARLTKLVYLSDWKSAIDTGKQITPISWYFDNYGPFVWDVKNTADQNPDIFETKSDSTFWGSKKLVFGLKDDGYAPKLLPEEEAAIEHVIKETKSLYWDNFIKLVYSTYPVASSDRYSYLNLTDKAAEYQLS